MKLKDRIVIIGLQRSGTNFVGEILNQKYNAGLEASGIWKHSLAGEVNTNSNEFLFLVVARHPIMWLQSCLLHTPRDLVERRASSFKDGTQSIASYAQIYKEFYEGWIASGSHCRIKIIQYENVLRNGASYFSDHLDLTNEESSDNTNFSKVPMSVSFLDSDKEAYLRMECSLERGLAYDFWRLLGNTPQSLGYSFDGVSFVAERSIRTLAYQLQRNPSSLSDAQLSQLLEAGPQRFSQDGPVLDCLADEIAKRRGNAASIDIRARAILAFDHEIESMGIRSGSNITQVDSIDRMINSLNLIKEKRIKETFEHYDSEIKSGIITPKMHSDALFYMSDCQRRLGNLETAINLARRAVDHKSIGNTDIYSVSPWLFHHLGHLLEQFGLLDEAAKAYRQAEQSDPNDYQHPYALSRVLLSLKLFSDAGVSGQRAAALKPDDSAIARHASWCLHRDAAARMAADPDHALTAIEKSIVLYPNFAPHHYLKAEILDRMSKIEQATASAQIACQCDGAVPWHYHFLGHLLKISGRIEEARSAFETANRLEPDNENHHRALASISEI